MPMQEYRCDKCNVEYEALVPLDLTDEPVYCPECGEQLRKQIGTPYFVIN